MIRCSMISPAQIMPLRVDIKNIVYITPCVKFRFPQMRKSAVSHLVIYNFVRYLCEKRFLDECDYINRLRVVLQTHTHQKKFYRTRIVMYYERLENTEILDYLRGVAQNIFFYLRYSGWKNFSSGNFVWACDSAIRAIYTIWLFVLGCKFILCIVWFFFRNLQLYIIQLSSVYWN